MLRRVITRGRLLCRTFGEAKETAEEQSLSKAGLIIPKSAPKVSPFVKKGIFIQAPEEEKSLNIKQQGTSIEEQESGVVLESIEMTEKRPQRTPREKRQPGEKKQPKAESTVALPTQAEQLKHEIPEYIFPRRSM